MHRIFPSRRLMALILLAAMTAAPFPAPFHECIVAQSTQTRQKGKGGKPASKKKKTSRRKRGSGKSASSTQAAPAQSAAEMKRQQSETRREIQLTQEQIKENDRSIKKSLLELGRIESDMAVTQRQIDATSRQVGELDTRITSLRQKISDNESHLASLRAQYLKAVKKMRATRRNASTLAFIFASESFNQALRRMRYLRQFSEWKDRQTEKIAAATSELKKQSTQLARVKGEKDVALRRQRDARQKLESQHRSQDAIVVELRNNGQALAAHLERKKAQAAQLQSAIAAAIAEEQRKAQAEEQARRKAAAEKAAAEKAAADRIAAEKAAAAEKAEAERALAERAAAEKAAEEKAAEERRQLLARQEAERQAEIAQKKSEKERREAEKRRKEEEKRLAEQQKRDREKAEKERKAEEKRLAEQKKRGGGKSAGSSSETYADVRKRRPRGGSTSSSSSSSNSSSATSPAPGNFAAMRGRLPRPSSGAFRVVRKFGRQSLPDLPDVEVDNTGIDAEVGSGASALAVYGGRVSSIYRLAGYSNVVILNHGDYFTIYCNLGNVNVKKGDMVKAGQPLGSVAPDEDDPSAHILHFELWKNRSKLNPLEWIQ